MESCDLGTTRQTQTCNGSFSSTASCCAWISAQLSETHAAIRDMEKIQDKKVSYSFTVGRVSYLPCTLWSLDIQYRTPFEPCFIFSVSDIKRRRFLLTVIPFFSDLCWFTRSCSQPSPLCFFMDRLTLLSSPAADAALRFLPDMMLSLVNKKERIGLGRCLLWITDFKNRPRAEKEDELREARRVKMVKTQNNAPLC